MIGVRNSTGHVFLTTPLQGWFVIRRLGLLVTDYKFALITHMKGDAKCGKSGGFGFGGTYGSLKVIENSTIRYYAYEFLLAFSSKCVSVLHRY